MAFRNRRVSMPYHSDIRAAVMQTRNQARIVVQDDSQIKLRRAQNNTTSEPSLMLASSLQNSDRDLALKKEPIPEIKKKRTAVINEGGIPPLLQALSEDSDASPSLISDYGTTSMIQISECQPKDDSPSNPSKVVVASDALSANGENNQPEVKTSGAPSPGSKVANLHCEDLKSHCNASRPVAYRFAADPAKMLPKKVHSSPFVGRIKNSKKSRTRLVASAKCLGSGMLVQAWDAGHKRPNVVARQCFSMAQFARYLGIPAALLAASSQQYSNNRVTSFLQRAKAAMLSHAHFLQTVVACLEGAMIMCGCWTILSILPDMLGVSSIPLSIAIAIPFLFHSWILDCVVLVYDKVEDQTMQQSKSPRGKLYL